MALVLVHGAGRSGAAAWPAQLLEGAVALDLSALATARGRAEAVAAAVRPGDVVVAHSLGGVAAALAMPMLATPPAALVLCEPALFDLARGDAAVEAHVAAMDAAHEALPSLSGFWARARPALLGGPFDEGRWEDERALASLLAGTERPWDQGIDAGMLRDVPTVVVTGGWNAEYEAIAAALVRAGARHEVLEGSGHRPQDDARFPAILAAAAG